MKKIFLLPLFAALTFTGCSSDEEVINQEASGNKEYGYVAVNIVQPTSISKRDASSGFEYGSNEENEAKTGLFFIFDDSGNKVGNAKEVVLSGEGTGNSPEVERIYNAVLVIDGLDGNKPTTTKQIVCILNAPSGLTDTSISTLSDLEGQIADYSISNPGAFIMTNSVYKDNGTKVLGTTILDENIVNSAEAALNNPVDIYVERVVAKVRANSTASFDNQGASITVGGETQTLTIKVTGIEIANIAQTSYLFKNITDINKEWTWVWDATNKRSYWETIPAAMTYGNKSYENIVNDSKPESGDFNINNVTSFSQYIQPNTSEQKTAVLVTAELYNGTDPYDFVYLRGGYFTPKGALGLIADYVANNGYWKKTESGYSQLDIPDFKWENKIDNPALTWLESYEVVARVNDGIEMYKKDGNNYTAVDLSDVNSLLSGDADNHPYVAQYYKDGKCYYFVNIDQSSVAGAGVKAHTYDGVVRNHIYDLTLNSIKGIGTPVFDPKDVIIPDRPKDEELWYLSARVNVLAWRLVKQTVDFE